MPDMALPRRDFLRTTLAAFAFQSNSSLTLDHMQEVMGPFPKLSTTPPPMETLETANEGQGYLRSRIRYLAEPGDWVPAWLLTPLPDRRIPQNPAVLCLHQTIRIGKDEPAGLGGNPDLHYARELAALGFTTLAPDYPTFGESTTDAYAMGYASATMKGIVNHSRAISLLASLGHAAERIGVCGHSLGGHNSLFLAAFDPRVRAVVTSCGFTSFTKYYGGNLTGWSHKGYMPRIAERYNKSPEQMPFDFPDILKAIAPRPIFINAPLHDANFDVSGVRDCVRIARPAFPTPEALQLHTPDAAHSFPPAVRKLAYAFLRKALAQ